MNLCGFLCEYVAVFLEWIFIRAVSFICLHVVRVYSRVSVLVLRLLVYVCVCVYTVCVSACESWHGLAASDRELFKYPSGIQRPELCPRSVSSVS